MSKRDDAFKSKCWDWAKEYFIATGRSHLIGVAERSVEMNEEETKE